MIWERVELEQEDIDNYGSHVERWELVDYGCDDPQVIETKFVNNT